MKRLLLHTIMIVFVLLVFDAAQAQIAQSGDHYRSQPAEFNFLGSKSNQKTSRIAFRLMPSETYSNLIHSRFLLVAAQTNGNPGRIPKFKSGSTFGNSEIYEDKDRRIGIGTLLPTSKLTVVGMIETINPSGGIKFADGTIQTTSATGALFSIPHDLTLTGNGTAASPLGVAVPLFLSGSVPVFGAIVKISNSANGDGVEAMGGSSNSSPGGNGLIGVGGNSDSSGSGGGDGVIGRGGLSDSGSGGDGIAARGGGSTSSFGGNGVDAVGGNSNSDFGGNGVDARGGDSDSSQGGNGVVGDGGNSNSSFGGFGVIAFGGDSGDEAGTGLFARGGTGSSGNGLAGKFMGDVDVTGTLSKGGGSFKIDHPLDPENKYLYHSFVESPDMKNIYDGVATLNSNGEAVIELPEWFQALNRDFRYLLTPIGAPMPGLFVAEKIKENRFRVAGGQPGMEVSWQVTGIRRDAFANKNRIKVEVEKTERERGHYLHPEAFDQPEELGVEWARHPEMMKQRKDARQQVKQKNQ